MLFLQPYVKTFHFLVLKWKCVKMNIQSFEKFEESEVIRFIMKRKIFCTIDWIILHLQLFLYEQWWGKRRYFNVFFKWKERKLLSDLFTIHARLDVVKLFLRIFFNFHSNSLRRKPINWRSMNNGERNKIKMSQLSWNFANRFWIWIELSSKEGNKSCSWIPIQAQQTVTKVSIQWV